MEAAVRRAQPPAPPQAIAYDMVMRRGWGDDEYACLVALWKKESGWRVNAYNTSSGAYGIPQALPGKQDGDRRRRLGDQPRRRRSSGA